MEASTLVIKVKYGDFLRRFNARVVDGKLELSMDKLKEKICVLFNLATDTELTLAYIDEDGETITIDDDDDLLDVMDQYLNPLRITVTMNQERNSSETLESVPNPLLEKLADLSIDLLSKVGLSCLSYISNSTAQNGIPESKATVTETKDSVSSKVDPIPLKAQGIHKGEVEPPRPSLNAAFVANNVSTEEKVDKASGSHLGPNPAFSGAHDHVKCDPSYLRTQSKLPCDFGNPQYALFGPYPGTSSNFLGSFWSPYYAYEGQLYGTPVENISAAQQQPASQAVSCGRNKSENDFNGMMGKDGAYNGTYLPAIHPHQPPSKGLQFFHAQEHGLLESQAQRGVEVNPRVSKLNSCFILDVTMIDGTVLAPLTPFTKIWRMKNNGTVPWPKKTRLVWIGGDQLSNTFVVELNVPAAGLAVNREFDVAVASISPEVPGQYVSYWKMAAPSGQNFGELVWIHIHVHATSVETPLGVPGFSLNPPVVNNVGTGNTTNNAIMDSLAEESQPEQDMNFPIADSSMTGSGATNLTPTAPSWFFYPSPIDPASYVNSTSPVIYPSTSPWLYTLPAPAVFYAPPSPPHMFYAPPPPSPPPTLPAHLASVNAAQTPPFLYRCPPSAAGNTGENTEELQPAAGNTQENTEEVQGIEEVENKLLRELYRMGFKQVDLNKDLLRFHEYDFVATVEDLCEGSDAWSSSYP